MSTAIYQFPQQEESTSVEYVQIVTEEKNSNIRKITELPRETLEFAKELCMISGENLRDLIASL